MHPILFELFGFKIYAYGALVALAFLAGIVLMAFRAKKVGDNPDLYLEAAIWFIIAGIGGARLFYFFWYPQVFLANPIGATLSQGGLVWYGGVVGVLLARLVWRLDVSAVYYPDAVTAVPVLCRGQSTIQ
jgi:phosphatidylglycerol---prolipoprotein diacylglyceryl transferase